MTIHRQAAIAGIGQTELAKASPHSALELAVQASLAALEDAGIDPAEVDGMLRFGAPFETVSHAALTRTLGLGELAYFAEIPLGGEASAGMVSQAAAAIASGQASVVLAFRSIKQSGGNRFGRADQALHGGPPEDADVVMHDDFAFTWPYWMMAPAHLFALWATRYMHVNGVSYEDFQRALGTIALAQRHYANANPGAARCGPAPRLGGLPRGPHDQLAALAVHDLPRERRGRGGRGDERRPGVFAAPGPRRDPGGDAVARAVPGADERVRRRPDRDLPAGRRRAPLAGGRVPSGRRLRGRALRRDPRS